MLQQSFDQVNKIMHKPVNATDEQALDVPVCITHRNGIRVLISKWKGNQEDIERFMQTGEIWLAIAADADNLQPMVEVFTENPFDNPTDDE